MYFRCSVFCFLLCWCAKKNSQSKENEKKKRSWSYLKRSTATFLQNTNASCKATQNRSREKKKWNRNDTREAVEEEKAVTYNNNATESTGSALSIRKEYQNIRWMAKVPTERSKSGQRRKEETKTTTTNGMHNHFGIMKSKGDRCVEIRSTHTLAMRYRNWHILFSQVLSSFNWNVYNNFWSNGSLDI